MSRRIQTHTLMCGDGAGPVPEGTSAHVGTFTPTWGHVGEHGLAGVTCVTHDNRDVAMCGCMSTLSGVSETVCLQECVPSIPAVKQRKILCTQTSSVASPPV